VSTFKNIINRASGCQGIIELLCKLDRCFFLDFSIHTGHKSDMLVNGRCQSHPGHQLQLQIFVFFQLIAGFIQQQV
jgi:hypothetical protein